MKSLTDVIIHFDSSCSHFTLLRPMGAGSGGFSVFIGVFTICVFVCWCTICCYILVCGVGIGWLVQSMSMLLCHIDFDGSVEGCEGSGMCGVRLAVPANGLRNVRFDPLVNNRWRAVYFKPANATQVVLSNGCNG